MITRDREKLSNDLFDSQKDYFYAKLDRVIQQNFTSADVIIFGAGNYGKKQSLILKDVRSIILRRFVITMN